MQYFHPLFATVLLHLLLRASFSFPAPLMDASSDSRTTSCSSHPFRLGYVTDVEGNLEFFKSFVDRSNVLDRIDDPNDRNDSHLEISLRDGCYFVYGGDSVDKGPGDIRFCRALVSLKKTIS
mmetsp:Transcript_6820/g.8459  ORF Transcript_6820/g.8459 Transcript_6820/m.8459 type:complete len:122 (+) Transcript_6820:59-424(+)